jgi:ABC-type transport system substrate-binding protein
VNYFKKHPYKWVPTDAVAAAEAPDPTKVIIRLSRPYAPFLA